jgi:vacuolar-type H+-ATPase subunit I/STV1
MDAIIEAVLIVGGSLVFSVAGVLFVRRKYHKPELVKHHEVAGYMLAIVSTLYAVLLGLIVVSAQTKYDQARLTAETEANCCSDIANFARGFPKEARNSIRAPLKAYYETVQSEDWEKVAQGEKEQSIPAYQGMWRAIADYQPDGNREVSCYQSVLSTMKSLADARRFRMFARKRFLSPIVWTVLIAGAIMTVVFTYFFWVESTFMQITLTVFVALFISLNLLLVKLFDNPYRHELLVKEGAFSFNSNVFAVSESETAGDKVFKVKSDLPDPVLK